MTQPRVLVTNDDGIGSYFLHALVEALKSSFDVYVAAPLSEQSWIGRAFSREGTVHVSAYDDFDCPAWGVSGTPSDCVNIALGHLLSAGQEPDAVVSGINIGYNSALPFILSSGTIGGALEGAFWGLPALAFSHVLPPDQFDTIRASHGKVEGEVADSLHRAAAHATRMTEEALDQEISGLTVHSVNFPLNTKKDTPIEITEPGTFHIGSLFDKIGDSEYQFGFKGKHKRLKHGDNTDEACLNQRGNISHTILDYSVLGVNKG